jgi:translation initiation factor 2 subunit 1
MPEVGDLVLATVKKILYHSVFVDLDEYVNLEGMIHISEISPGRIRTVRDYVQEGKKIICKIIDIKEGRHLNLSLRRVPVTLRIKKSNEIKQEGKAEKMIEKICGNLKKDIKDYKETFEDLIEEYGSLNAYFYEVYQNNELIKKIKDKKLADLLLENIKEKVKPQKVTIHGVLKLKCFSEDGINVIKNVLINYEREGIKITYIGAPKYKIIVVAGDYKEAENVLKEKTELILKEIKEKGGIGEFLRDG